MIEAVLCISNADDKYIMHKFPIEEVRYSPARYKSRVRRFIRAAEQLMKESRFCGIEFTQGVFIPQFPEFNEAEKLNPAVIFSEPDCIAEGLKHFSKHESKRLQLVLEKLSLWNPDNVVDVVHNRE